MYEVIFCWDRRGKEPAFRWIFLAALFIIDRGAKLAATYYLSETMMEKNVRIFSLALYHNHGISFSMLGNFPSAGLAVSIMGIVAFGVICFKDASLRLSTGALFLWAGATGNLIDRLLYGYVIDWFYIGAQNIGVHINLADIWLCAGCLMVVYHYAKGSA